MLYLSVRRPTFQIVSRPGLEWLECAPLARQPWVQHAFSMRSGGASRAPATGLNLGFIETDTRARVEKNRQRFFHELGVGKFSLAELRQIHSATVYQVVRSGRGKLDYRPSGYSLPQTVRNGLP